MNVFPGGKEVKNKVSKPAFLNNLSPKIQKALFPNNARYVKVFKQSPLSSMKIGFDQSPNEAFLNFNPTETLIFNKDQIRSPSVIVNRDDETSKSSLIYPQEISKERLPKIKLKSIGFNQFSYN